MNLNQIKAIIFDIDGTLLDTREFILQSFEHALSAKNYPIPNRAIMRQAIGLPLDECYRIFTKQNETNDLCDLHREFQKNNYHLVTLYPHTKEVLIFLREELNLKTAVWSTRKLTLKESLERMEIIDLFDCIYSGDNVGKLKPHPEGMLSIMNELNLQPDQCAYIGDTVVDMQAGKNAQAKLTVGITHGFGTAEELEKAGADLIVHSLNDFTNYLKKF